MSLDTITTIRRKIIEIQGFLEIEAPNERFDEIYDRFKGFFNGRGNDYLGALAYFHCLRDEQKERFERHPTLGPSLDCAIDEVMYGNFGNVATN